MRLRLKLAMLSGFAAVSWEMPAAAHAATEEPVMLAMASYAASAAGGGCRSAGGREDGALCRAQEGASLGMNEEGAIARIARNVRNAPGVSIATSPPMRRQGF